MKRTPRHTPNRHAMREANAEANREQCVSTRLEVVTVPAVRVQCPTCGEHSHTTDPKAVRRAMDGRAMQLRCADEECGQRMLARPGDRPIPECDRAPRLVSFDGGLATNEIKRERDA